MEDHTRIEVVSAFRVCDALVLSVPAEAQPGVTIVAMASCKPIIYNDTGCVSELCRDGVLKNISKMAMQMRCLTEEPTGIETLGWQPRKYFEQYHTPEVINQAWLVLLKDLLALPSVSKSTITKRNVSAHGINAAALYYFQLLSLTQTIRNQ